MSQEGLAGLREPQAESECTAQTTEDLPDEPCASTRHEIVGKGCERAGSENDESSGSPSGKHVSRSRSESFELA